MLAEITENILSSWSSVASVIGTILAVSAFAYSLYRFFHSAKFAILTIPEISTSDNIERYIIRSGLDELRVKRKDSAVPITKETKIASNKVKRKSKPIIVKSEKADIPFIIQNIGVTD